MAAEQRASSLLMDDDYSAQNPLSEEQFNKIHNELRKTNPEYEQLLIERSYTADHYEDFSFEKIDLEERLHHLENQYVTTGENYPDVLKLQKEYKALCESVDPQLKLFSRRMQFLTTKITAIRLEACKKFSEQIASSSA